MRNNITFGLFTISISFFIGCGSGSSNTSEDNTISDIILKKNETLNCTNSSQFSVVPTDKPTVQFHKDINNGDVTVILTKNSQGFVTVKNCTQK